MKKPNYIWLIIVQCFMARSQLHAQQSWKSSKNISITDFRSPVSLTEVLQEGLNNITALLEGNISSESLQAVEQEYSRLSSYVDDVQNTTRYHTILSSDRDYLQNMIDRIDQLIEKLEGSKKKSSDEQVLHSIFSLSQQLKNKLSQE